MLITWLTDHSIELFGALTGIIYVILEIRQITWLWPVGIVTSAVYVWVFFTGKLYADMGLQVYYLIISGLGWYWWVKGAGHRAQGRGQEAEGTGHRAQDRGQEAEGEGRWAEGAGQEAEGTGHSAQGPGQGAACGDSPLEGGKGDVKDHITNALQVTRIKHKLALKLLIILIVLYTGIYLALRNFTDSPVPGWDAFITSLSIVGTWMLARKIYEHWYLWILVNTASIVICLMRELYPTVGLYSVYLAMSFIGLYQWKKSIT